jgi:hypothetical protein
MHYILYLVLQKNQEDGSSTNSIRKRTSGYQVRKKNTSCR